MLNNRLWVGLVWGALVPFVSYALLLVLQEQLALATGKTIFQERTLLLIAICANLIPFQLFQRRRALFAMRGIIILTLVYSAVWVFLFARDNLFNNL